MRRSANTLYAHQGHRARKLRHDDRVAQRSHRPGACGFRPVAGSRRVASGASRLARRARRHGSGRGPCAWLARCADGPISFGARHGQRCRCPDARRARDQERAAKRRCAASARAHCVCRTRPRLLPVRMSRRWRQARQPRPTCTSRRLQRGEQPVSPRVDVRSRCSTAAPRNSACLQPCRPKPLRSSARWGGRWMRWRESIACCNKRCARRLGWRSAATCCWTPAVRRRQRLPTVKRCTRLQSCRLGFGST